MAYLTQEQEERRGEGLTGVGRELAEAVRLDAGTLRVF